MQACLENDVSLLAYSPMAGGTLSGKYIEDKHAKSSRLNIFPGYMERYNKSAARAATIEYMKVRTLHLAPLHLLIDYSKYFRLPERQAQYWAPYRCTYPRVPLRCSDDPALQ
jgi:aryl-alcohol dehydrogenase-like predicted oxidoreductase